MIVDEVIWEIINNGQCSFKTKLETNVFCRNEHNVTGLCNRNSCPLANSRYATVLEDKGACYLTIKTAERAHTPRDMWEKIKLDKSYNKALEQIDEHLQYWPEFLKHKCKQRFTRYRQILVKKRKMKLRDTEIYEVVSRKAEKREKSRGKKAEKAALIENHIEQEILQRMKEGKYTEIHNLDLKLFNKVLDEDGVEDKNINYQFNDEDMDNVFISDLNDADSITGEDDEFNDKSTNLDKSGSTHLKKKRGKKIKLEYEEETAKELQTQYN